MLHAVDRNKFATIKSEKVLTAYLKRFRPFIEKFSVSEIRVLGSFGKDEISDTSDLDIWIILNRKSVGLKLLTTISEEEIKVRQSLSKEFGLKNLARHRSSIFTEEEKQIYETAFTIRVGTPYQLGEQKLLFTRKTQSVSITNNLTKEDLFVSISEYYNNYKKAFDTSLQKKWIRRIVQEIVYHRNRIRLSTNVSIDKFIKDNYSDSHDKILLDATQYIDELKQDINVDDTLNRSLLHSLAWTLEKVRWELIDSYLDNRYFSEWKSGSKRNFGFNPYELSELIIESARILRNFDYSTKDLGKVLVVITRDPSSTKDLELFHTVLTQWILKSCKNCIAKKTSNREVKELSFVAPRIVSGKKVITRVATSNSSRFIMSEKLALEVLSPKLLISQSLSNDIITQDMFDLGGKTANSLDIQVNLNDYVAQLHKLHKVKMSFFGRINSEWTSKNYVEYLESRIKHSSLTEKLKSRLSILIQDHKEKLLNVQPVLCHMDSGPRNLVLASKGKLHIVDFEHSSGCAKEWDIERISFQLSKKVAIKFKKKYYKKENENLLVSKITRLVMLALFASNLSEKENILKSKIYSKVKEELKDLPSTLDAS